MAISDTNKRLMLEFEGGVGALAQHLLIGSPRRGEKGADALQEAAAGLILTLALFEPWAEALREDAAVELPAKHSAFRGCSWKGKHQSELLLHLSQSHKHTLQAAADAYHCSYTLEDRMYAAYNAALTVKVQKSAPLATYSIDRRCMYQYVTKLGNDQVDSLICFCCARRFPYVKDFLRNEINWRTPLQQPSTFMGMSAAATETILGYETYLKKYGHCRGEDMPNLRDHAVEFEDWLMTVFLDGCKVQLLCCPEDLDCSQQGCIDSKTCCARCRLPVCVQCEKSLTRVEPTMPAAALTNDMMICMHP